MVLWCSWLSRQSNTLKVSSSSLDKAIQFFLPGVFFNGCQVRCQVRMLQAACDTLAHLPGGLLLPNASGPNCIEVLALLADQNGLEQS